MTEALIQDLAGAMNRIAKLMDEAKAAQKRMFFLLAQVGEQSICRGPNCKAAVVLVRHRNGAMGIYEPDGTYHFGTCPDRELFRRSKAHGNK